MKKYKIMNLPNLIKVSLDAKHTEIFCICILIQDLYFNLPTMKRKSLLKYLFCCADSSNFSSFALSKQI